MLYLICDEAVINHAIETSSHHFKTEDLDALYGFSDAEALVGIANKQNIQLPESLSDYAEVFEEDLQENTEQPIPPEELSAEYDYMLDCLHNAHRLLKKAYQFSLIDTNKKTRAVTVTKAACIADAQSYISAAIDSWSLLDIPNLDKQLLCGIWPNISDLTMWQNYLFEGFFTNIMVKREIRKVMKNIETAFDMIRKMRNTL